MLLVGVGLAGRIWAEEAPKQPAFDALLEAIYGDCPEEMPYEVLQERLWEYYQDPLELNQTSREVLQRLGMLTEQQLDQFFSHLAKNGPLVSIYELQAIPAFDLPTIQRLVPFVKVEEGYTDYHNRALWAQGLGARDSYGLVRYERTLETKQGYLPNKKSDTIPYVGAPDGLLTRLSVKQPHWGLGLAARAKAGEALTWDPATQRYGPSVARFHWVLKHKKSLKALVLGDYVVGYGEGLVLNAGFSMNKGSETIKIIRTNNLGIRPYTSLTSAAFRGIATTWQWGAIAFTAYYSTVGLDGRLEGDTSASGQYVQSIARGGYYRTESEIAKKGQVNEQVIGSTLVYQGPTRGAVVGINTLYSHYSLPIQPDIQKGNPLRFSGQEHANGSLFYRYLWQNFHFFGEGALSRNGGKAAVVGTVASLSRYVDTTVLWRHYDQDFHGPFGKGFKENSSDNSNERGLYLGTRVRPWQRLYLDAYYDYFYFPWFWDEASAGHSWLGKATYQPSRAILIYLQFKTKVKAQKVPETEEIAMGTKNNYKLCYKHKLSKNVSINSEVQCNSYQQLDPLTWGYAAVQDVVYKIRKLQLKGRVAWFSTEAGANKLTFYEPNVLYAGFNFPAYQGQGMRYCLLVCYKPTPAFRLEMKYTLTHYREKDKIGSGQETIEGNVKNDVRLQAIFRF